MNHISIDIETYSSVDIGKSGLYKYVQSPDFQILLFAYSVDGFPVNVVDLLSGEEIPEDIMNALEDPMILKHAYNAAFEWYCLNTICDSPISGWRCTMLHGLYCGYPAGLDAAGKALGLPQDKKKSMAGKALIKLFCTPTKPSRSNGMRTRTLPQHEPEKWRLFKEYNRQDVVAEMEIERRLSGFPVPDDIQEQWKDDQLRNAFGVAVDEKLIEGALAVDSEITAELKKRAVEITKLDNPNSLSQLKPWLESEIGRELPNLQKETVA